MFKVQILLTKFMYTDKYDFRYPIENNKIDTFFVNFYYVYGEKTVTVEIHVSLYKTNVIIYTTQLQKRILSSQKIVFDCGSFEHKY